MTGGVGAGQGWYQGSGGLLQADSLKLVYCLSIMVPPALAYDALNGRGVQRPGPERWLPACL
jgi:hypothetical protein